MTMKPRYFKVGDDWWRIEVRDLPTNDRGECDYERKTITLATNLEDSTRMAEILIHEATHAASRDLSEEAVERIAVAATNALESMRLLS